MKFTILLTKVSTIAFILAAGITHSMATEVVDCAVDYVAPKAGLTKALTKPYLDCVKDNDTINKNIIFAKSMSMACCGKKKGYSYGNYWSSLGKALSKPQCERIGKVLDCYYALEKCGGDEDCSNKTKNRECKNLSTIVYPAPGATAEAPGEAPAEAPAE